MKTKNVKYIDLAGVQIDADVIPNLLRDMYTLKEPSVYRNALCDDPEHKDDPFPAPYIVDVPVLNTTEEDCDPEANPGDDAARELRWKLDLEYPGWRAADLLVVEIA